MVSKRTAMRFGIWTKLRNEHSKPGRVPAIAKSKRVIEKHLGIKPKGWNTKFKWKVSGEAVRKGTP